MMLRLLKQYYPIRNLFFIFGEGLAIFISVLLACFLLLDIQSLAIEKWLYFKIFLITIVCQICLYYNDLYDFNITDTFREFAVRLFQALGVASIFLAVIYIVLPETIIGKGIFLISIGFVVFFIIGWRFCYKLVLDYGMFNQKIILLGNSELAKNIVEEIDKRKDCGYKIEAWIPELNITAASSGEPIKSSHAWNESGGIRLQNRICSFGLAACEPDLKLNSIADPIENNMAVSLNKQHYTYTLCEKAKELNVKKIIVAIKEKRGAFPDRELLDCRTEGIDVIEGNSFYEMLTGKLIVDHINPAWLIFSDGFHKPFTKRFLKRSIDIFFSLIMLITSLPVIIVTAVLIKIESKGPVIFSQERVGMNKQIYRVHKFRSMIANAEEHSGPVWAKEDDDRITGIGKFIRKCRIDEIPQLWNVLKGEMSFVGPRPEREFFVKQLEKIIPYYRERFTVKPGITGWAQVSYGYGASVEDAVEKLNYDLFYIKNMSIFMDLMVIMRTVKTVFFSRGAR